MSAHTNKTSDKTQLFHGATIQHGPLSNRIYLMKTGDSDPSRLIPAMESLAAENRYTKIFAKIPSSQSNQFIAAGYTHEATVPGFFQGSEDAVFLGKFLGPSRLSSNHANDIAHILDIAQKKQTQTPLPDLPETTCLRHCLPEDAIAMAEIYRTVFPTYPFPIDDPGYIRHTMADNIAYYGITINGHLAALSSAEMDMDAANVEMTDFATLPDYRGNGYALHLLSRMEAEMRTRGIPTAYTIARAISPGMNITFAKMGYAFGGTLVNNTNISGSIESMNVWYKSLL